MITEMWDTADICTDKWSPGKVRFKSTHFRLYEMSKLLVKSHYGPGVNSASNRNEYQEHFLGVKVADA